MLEQLKSIIVIAGCQRSGTTLCGQILGAHPSCFLLDEPDGLYRWFDQTENGKLDEGHPLMALINKANQKYKSGFKRIDGSGMEAKLKCGVEHLVLKAPNLTYDFLRLKSLKIATTIIYPVRDPRAVVSSMQGLDFIVEMDRRQADWLQKYPELASKHSDILGIMQNGTDQHIRLANVWKLKTGLFSEFESIGLAPLVFKYEDLVSNPEDYRNKLFEYAGLAITDSQPRHEEVFRGRGPGLTERERPTDTTSIEKWRDRLTKTQATEVLEQAGDLAFKFGYTATPAHVTPPGTQEIKLDSPIVLVGRGGSGTRLLSDIVQGQGIFLGNRVSESGDSVEWVDTIYELAVRRAIPRQGAEMSNLKGAQLLRSKAMSVLRSAELQANIKWGWKLPETMMVLPDVFQAFPEARLIHLVRHPVTSSLRRTHVTSRADNPIGLAVLTAAYKAQGIDVSRIKTDPDYLRNAYTWLYQVKRVHNYAQSKLSEASYKLVKYEDIIAFPSLTENDILEFIGLTSPSQSSLDIQKERVMSYDANDPRIAETWSICGSFALEIGYQPHDLR